MGVFSTEQSITPGARLTPKDLEEAIDKIPGWQRYEREFAKASFREYWRAGNTRGWITSREFDEALLEMSRNLKDPIDSLRLSKLRQMKQELFRVRK